MRWDWKWGIEWTGDSEEGDGTLVEGLCSARLQEEVDSEQGFEEAKRFSLASLSRAGIRGGAGPGDGDVCPKMGRRSQMMGAVMVVAHDVEQFMKILSPIILHVSSSFLVAWDNRPGSVAFKMCSTELWGCPGPFQGVSWDQNHFHNNIKTHYLPFLLWHWWCKSNMWIKLLAS